MQLNPNKKEKCPLQNKCLESEIVYQAKVEVENKETKTYNAILIVNNKSGILLLYNLTHLKLP